MCWRVGFVFSRWRLAFAFKSLSGASVTYTLIGVVYHLDVIAPAVRAVAIEVYYACSVAFPEPRPVSGA